MYKRFNGNKTPELRQVKPKPILIVKAQEIIGGTNIVEAKEINIESS